MSTTEDQEREYATRVCWLIMTVGKDIVRQKLDGFYLPGIGVGTLDEKLNISCIYSKLHTGKAFNSLDLRRLYPSTRPVSSIIFDISLLIKLLRNICSLPAPKNGWDALPLPLDMTLSDDLARIKYYRNTIAHNGEYRLSEDDFNIYWKELSQAFIRLGGTSFKTKIDSLLSGPLTESANEAKKELNQWFLKDLDVNMKFDEQFRKLEEMCKRLDENKDNKDFLREVRDILAEENAKNADAISVEQKGIHLEHMQAVVLLGDRLRKVETSTKESCVFTKYIIPGFHLVTIGLFGAYALRKYIHSTQDEKVNEPKITNGSKPYTSRTNTSNSKLYNRKKTSSKETEIKGAGKWKNIIVQKVNEHENTNASKLDISRGETFNCKSNRRKKTSSKESELKGDPKEGYENNPQIDEKVNEPKITNGSKPYTSRTNTSNSKLYNRKKTSSKETEIKGAGKWKNIIVQKVNEHENTNASKPDISRGETFNCKSNRRKKTSSKESELKGDPKEGYENNPQIDEKVNEPKITNGSKPYTSRTNTSNSKLYNRKKTSSKETEIKGVGKWKNIIVQKVNEHENTNASKPDISRGETFNCKSNRRKKTSSKESELKGDPKEGYENNPQIDEKVNEPKITNGSKPNTSRTNTSNSKLYNRKKISSKETEIKGAGKWKNIIVQKVNEHENTNASKPDISRGETFNCKSNRRKKTSSKESELKGDPKEGYENNPQIEMSNIENPDNYQCDDCENTLRNKQFNREPKPLDTQTETIRKLKKSFNTSMPDFADQLGVELRTPSPQRQLLNKPHPEALIPADKYRSSENTPNTLAFDIGPSQDIMQPTIASSHSTVNYTEEPKDTLSILDLNTVTTVSKPNRLSTSTKESVKESHPTCKNEEYAEQLQEIPLDVLVTPDQPEEIPDKPLTPIFDCFSSTNEWKLQPPSLSNNSNEHLCLDPRVFFAGAPSQYQNHSLALTLREKVNLCRKSQKARYQRQLVPLGVRTIMKEERCYFPDGTMLELKEIWTSDEAPTLLEEKEKKKYK